VTTNEWNVGILNQSLDSILQEGRRPDSHVRWLPRSVSTRYAADPFGVARGGSLFIFHELLTYGRPIPAIVYVEVTPEGRISPPRPVLRADCHISYPFLLEVGGDLYLVPESARAREVALFKCKHFPDVWTKAGVLIKNFGAVDSTIVRYQDRWWLFCTAGRHMSELHIWHARDLLGPWEPHPRNPVKVDVHSARPGGTPFLYKGQLYRPTIDTVPWYGCRVIINRVDEVSVDGFSEEPVATVSPEPGGLYSKGLHTVAAVGNLTLIDGLRTSSVLHPVKTLGRLWGLAARATRRRLPGPATGARPEA
jgi:hypothetical protein